MAKATGSAKGSTKAVITTKPENVIKTTTEKAVEGATVTDPAQVDQPAAPVAEQVTEETILLQQEAETKSGDQLHEGDQPEVLKAESIKPEELGSAAAEIVTTSPDGETKKSLLPGDKKEDKRLTDVAVELHIKMEKYRAAYPNEKRFYITSDEQVFLSGNKIEALEHQRSLDKSLDVLSYEV